MPQMKLVLHLRHCRSRSAASAFPFLTADSNRLRLAVRKSERSKQLYRRHTRLVRGCTLGVRRESHIRG